MPTPSRPQFPPPAGQFQRQATQNSTLIHRIFLGSNLRMGAPAGTRIENPPLSKVRGATKNSLEILGTKSRLYIESFRSASSSTMGSSPTGTINTPKDIR